MNRGELEHFHFDVPDAGIQVHGVAPVFIGIGHYFLFALGGCDNGSGDHLIRGADRATMSGGKKLGGSQIEEE
jgi:hypothetical protein